MKLCSARACSLLCAFPLYLRSRSVFSYVEIWLCNSSRTKKEGTRMCEEDDVLAHMSTHTHTHACGHFLSVLFPSATVGCDTAESRGGQLMAEGETRAETIAAPNVNTIWRSGATEMRILSEGRRKQSGNSSTEHSKQTERSVERQEKWEKSKRPEWPVIWGTAEIL